MAPSAPVPAPPPPDSILTLGSSATAEIKEKRSRFIALACPAASEEEARRQIAKAARRYHDSRHVCHAWRLGIPPHTQEARNDAGEPSGTAGEPILAALRRRDLVDALVIVVRYFGGIKLGTGGLARAYGLAAEEALNGARIEQVLLGREFLLEFPYSQQKTIRHLLTTASGRILDEQYGEDVAWRIWLPHSAWRGFGDRLTESSAGQIALRETRNDSAP